MTLEELRTHGALEELAEVFAKEAAADELLDWVGFPAARRPTSASMSIHFWNQVCHDIERGLIEGGLERLLVEAWRLYPENEVFGKLARAAGLEPPRPEPRSAEALRDLRPLFQVPAPKRDFTGRDQELAELHRIVAEKGGAMIYAMRGWVAWARPSSPTSWSRK